MRRVLCFTLTLILFISILPQNSLALVAKLTNECRTNPSLKNDTDAALFFNDCRRDVSDLGLLRYVSEQIFLWANADAYLLYITILLAFIPTIAWWNNPDPELSAKAYRMRFLLLMLLFRVSLAYNMSIWLISAFNLEKPCVCIATNSNDEQVEVIVGVIEGTGPWGMPSLECVTGTLIAIFFYETFQPILGLAMILFVPMAQLCLGYNSLGQVIAGIFIAIMMHVYHSRSALFLRPLDTTFSFILGYSLLSVAKDKYPSEDFDWARVFLSTFVWQIFFYCLIWIYYDAAFIMETGRKSISSMQYSDFAQYVGPDKLHYSLSPQRPHENKLTAISILALYIVLMILRISTSNFDAWIG